MTQQKQWLLDYGQLWELLFALKTDMDGQRDKGATESMHFQKLEELDELFKAIISNVEWRHSEETGERICPTERVMISLIPHSGEWWSDPYAVVPVAGQTASIGKQRWAVIEKGAGRPIGEKTYSQKTHAYRACRRLNEAAKLAFEDKRGWFPTPALSTEAETEIGRVK